MILYHSVLITLSADGNHLTALRLCVDIHKGTSRNWPMVVLYAKMSSEGRTELQIKIFTLSGVRDVQEVAGDVHFGVAPHEACQECKKLIFPRNFHEISANFHESSRIVPEIP